MATIAVRIEGKTPLLMNRFSDESAMRSSSGVSQPIVGERGSPREQATAKLYTDSDGGIVVPQPNLMRCLVDAGTFFKAGKSKITTQATSMIPACVDMDFIVTPLGYKGPWDVDTRPVRIPSTGGRILCHRPYFHDWWLEFECTLDDTMITISLFRDIWDAAGKRIGLCDFRPARKGPFGKFLVTSWRRTDTEPANGRSLAKSIASDDDF